MLLVLSVFVFKQVNLSDQVNVPSAKASPPTFRKPVRVQGSLASLGNEGSYSRREGGRAADAGSQPHASPHPPPASVSRREGAGLPVAHGGSR